PVMVHGQANVGATPVPGAAVLSACRGIGSISPVKLGWMGAMPKSWAGTGTTGSPMNPTTATIAVAVTRHRLVMCYVSSTNADSFAGNIGSGAERAIG